MELKVWLDGVVRVVCGLSLNTSCQDVVIALAQAIGQTGRYILILKLRGTERQLVADDCPLEHLTQLGQLATEVQFILRRTGPSLSHGQEEDTPSQHVPLARPSGPEPHKTHGPHKALTFNLGPSILPKRTKPARAWSPSPRASPELRASPVAFLETINPVNALPSSDPKEEAFRRILQQQRRLQDLEVQLEALERETEVRERQTSPAMAPSLVPTAGELEELEQRLRQNQEELTQTEQWKQQLQAESDREQDLHRRLNQIHSSMDNHSNQLKELHGRSAHLEKTLRHKSHRQRSQASTQQSEEAMRPLKTELYYRLLLGEELDATLTETQRELQTAEERLQDRLEMDEELHKELRQCKLQQFIQQTGSPNSDQTNSLSVNEVYLSSAGIMDYEQPSHRQP